VGGVLFDRLYRTASLPASTPLLFLLSIWGLVTAFRPEAIGKVARTRLLLLASGSAGAALMLWGYIAPRYLGDFVPFLVLASAVAAADIFRRLEGRRRSIRAGTVAAIAVAGLFSIAANVGTAIVPNEEWDTTQVHNFLQTQKTVSDLTGHPLRGNVLRGDALPEWGPAGTVYVIGNCNGLYVSNGEDYATVPTQQYERSTWMTAELGHSFQHTFQVTVKNPEPGKTESVPLLTAGNYTVAMSATPTSDPQKVKVTFSARGAGTDKFGSVTWDSGVTKQLAVITDPAKHLIQVTSDGVVFWQQALPIDTSIHVVSTPQASSAISVTDETASSPQPTLCRSLIH
jgi:hypothetical protein